MILQKKVELLFRIASCVCVLVMNGIAQSYHGGGGPYSHTVVPFSPREIGMGSTGTAFSYGPFAWYWNPALSKPVISNSTFYFGSATGLDLGNIYRKYGLSKSSLEYSDIGILFIQPQWSLGGALMARTFTNIYYTTFNESASEIFIDSLPRAMSLFTFIVSASTNDVLGSGVTTGINVRLGNSNLTLERQEFKLQYQGIDIGFKTELWVKELSFGTTFIMLHDERNNELLIRTGLSYLHSLFEKSKIRYNADIITGDFQPPKMNTGIELSRIGYDEASISLRGGIVGGIQSDSSQQGFLLDTWAVGFGFTYVLPQRSVMKHCDLDISYINTFNKSSDGVYQMLLYSQTRISITLGF